MLPNAYSYCLFTVTVSDMKSRSTHAFMCVMVVVVGVPLCVCVCVCMEWLVFIAVASDETSFLVAVHLSMKSVYQLCDRGRAVMWSNVSVSQ